MSDAARRWERELSEGDRSRLETAHRDLRQAAYEPFIGGPFEADQPIPVHDAAETRAAQEAVEAAQDRLWRLRGGVARLDAASVGSQRRPHG